jgi:hypothetical protein
MSITHLTLKVTGDLSFDNFGQIIVNYYMEEYFGVEVHMKVADLDC